MDDQIRAHLETLEAAPGDVAAFRALEGLYEQEGRFEELAALLEARSSILPPPEAAQLLLRAAEVARNKVGSAARAEELYRSVLAVEPAHREALAALATLAEERQDWNALAAVLERSGQVATAPTGAALAALRLGRVHEEKLGRRDRAALQYARAARLDPSLVEARDRALAACLALRRFAAAKKLLDVAREGGAATAPLAADFVRLGAALAGEALFHDVAMDALIEAQALDRSAPGAVEARERLSSLPRRWREEAAALEAQAAHAERREGADLLLRSAQLHAAYDPDGAGRAVERLERAWALSPGHVAVLELLERILAERKDFGAIAAALDRLVSTTRDRTALVQVHLAQAQLRLVRLGDGPGALAALQRALELEPANETAALQVFEQLIDAGQFAEALNGLERHFAAAPEKAPHAPLRVRAAEIARARLGQPDRARRHLEAALRADPASAPAGAALTPLLVEAGEWERFAEVQAMRAAAEPDPAERVRLLERLADAQLEHLDQPREAFRTLVRALALDPRRGSVRTALEEAARRAGALPAFCRALRAAAATLASEPAARKPLLRRAAEVLDRDLGRSEDAAAAWREVAALDPADGEAAAALAACEKKARSQADAAGELHQRFAQATGPARREAGLSLARLLSDTARPEQAAGIWRDLLADAPDDLQLLWGVHGVLEATPGTRAAAERAQILGRLATLTAAASERAELELERAALLIDPLSRPGEAAGVLVTLLAGGGLTGPQQQLAVVLLEKLLARGIDPLRIARVLAPLHAARGEPQKQVTMLELVARRLPPGAEPRERARHLLDASVIRADRLGDARGALSDAAEALRACPDHAEARRRCEQLAHEVGAQAELFSLLVEAARRLEGRADDEFLLRRRAAVVAEEELGSSEDAAAQLRRCLLLRPGDAEVLASLTRVSLAAERWEEASDLLLERANGATGPEKHALLGQLADVLAEHLKSPQAAADVYREALELASAEQRPRILGRLAAALGAGGDLAGQAKALGELATLTSDPAEAARLGRESARLAAGVGDHAGAVARLAAAVQADPGDTAAAASLEAALADPRPEVVLVAARALLAVHTLHGDEGGRIRALVAQARSLAEPAERAAAWRAAAEAYEHQPGAATEALAAITEAVRTSPGDADGRRDLRRLADAAREGEAAARVLEEAASAVPLTARVPVLKELADWYERRLESRDRAAAVWEQALAAAPGLGEALVALRRLHRAAERWPQLVTVCEELARRATSPAARQDPLREIATVAEARLGDLDRAVAAWSEVQELNPEDHDAAPAVERLLERLDRPRELAQALERRLARAFDADAAYRLGELRRTKLGDPAGALAIQADLARREPGRADAREALAQLAAAPGPVGREALAAADAALRAAGDQERRVTAREARLEAVDEPQERARLHAELRSLLEREVGSGPRALAAARQAFAEGGTARAEADEDLRRLARTVGQPAQVADAYEAAAAAGGPDAAEWRRRAARFRDADLQDLPGAIAAWKAILAGAPEDAEALETLERLYASAQSSRERLEVARRRAALATGPERVAALGHAAEIALVAGDLEAEVALLAEARSLAPRDGAILSALEEALGRAGRAEDQIEVLAALADVSGETDPEARRQHLQRRAGLLEQASDPSRPVEAYAAILAEWPRDAGAEAGLERLLARPDARPSAERLLEDVQRLAGDPVRLARLLEIRLEGTSADRRPALLAEIASLRERAGDRAGAFAARLRGFGEAAGRGDPEPAARADLERLAGDPAAWEAVAGAYQAALTSASPAAALELRRRLAVITGERLGALDRAAGWWDEVATADPSPEPLAALVRVRRRQGAKRELVAAMGRLAEATAAAQGKKDLLFEVAKIMDEQLADREGAIQAYRKILAIDPEDPTALRLLGKLLGAAERWEDLVAVMDREASGAEARADATAEAAELRFRVGRIRQLRLSDAPGSLAAYQKVLERAPRHPGTIAALEELSRTSGPVAIQAAQILEPIYAGENEHQKVVEVLEARAASETAPATRAVLLRRVAELYGRQLKNAELAFLAASRALAADPDDLESLALTVSFGGTGGLAEELAALLAENADRAHDPAARAEYLRQQARLEADPARAAELWQRLLDLRPEDREASAGLLATVRKGGDAEALDKALRRALALEEAAPARARLLGELAVLQDERLGDPAGAVATLKRQLELEPGQRDALARLDWICVSSERWVELADVLGREIGAAQGAGDTAALLGFRHRLAELKETRLHDREGAMALYEEVLAVRPDHPEVLARLEAIIAKDASYARAALALEAAYASLGDHAKQALALETRAAERPDPLERKALWMQLADLREGPLAEPEMAFLALCKAFREDPNDAALRLRLEQLAERGGNHEELAAIYEDEIDRLAPGPMAQVALVLGRLYEGPLAGPTEAAAFFRRARSLDPEAAPVALPALERLYQRLESWPELAEVQEAQAGAVTGAERVQRLFRLGQLCQERLADLARAAGAFERALDEDPRHLPSLQALEAIYEQAGRKEDLFRNLTAQRGVVQDGASKERVLARMAELAAELGRPDDAIGLWHEVLAVRPRHEGGLAALESLLEQQGRWTELAQHLRLRIGATVDRREITRLNDRLGWVLGTKLGDAAQAIQSYRAVLDSDPRNRRALEALRDIHAAQGDHEALAGALRRLIPLQEDAAGVKAVRLDLADVLLRAGQKTEAVEQGKRAFDIEPHTAPDLVRIEEVFRAGGAAADGVRAAEARAALLAKDGPALAVPAWLAVADLWKAQKRPDAAAAALEKVLELEPPNRTAYDQLRELHATAGNWRAWARVGDLFAPQVTDPAEKLAILKEVASAHEKRLGQKEMAFLAWCRALAEAPGDLECLEEAARLGSETKANEEFDAVLEQVSEDARGMVRARLLLRLGALRDGALDDAEGAESAYRRALEADPASPDALDALAGLFKRRGRLNDLVIALEQKLEAAAGLDEKKALLIDVARLYDEELHDVDEAVVALRRILELDGGDAQAIDALATLFRREHRWGELAAVLARARDLAADDAARIKWQLQIAALYENEIGDDEAAVEGYRTVLGLDDRDREALAGLERLYTKLDRFAELNRVYERQVQLSTDTPEQVRILARSAGIFEEKMHDQARAIAQNEQILGLDGANLPAVKALERLYREAGLFDKLIIVMQHHLGQVTDRKEQVALQVAIGEVWWKDMSRVDRAEAIFSQALQADPESREAVSALGRLYERSGNWNLALDMLRREARIAGASRDGVDIYVRLGAINEDMLMDLGAAKEAYGKALALDPGCLPAIRAMKGLLEREKNRDAYLEMLVSEAKYAEDEDRRAELWTEVGRIQQEERDDREGAIRSYEEALKRKPEHLPAARPLSDLYVAMQRWPDAERVLDGMVSTLGGGGDAKELCRQAYRQGYVAEKLGQRDKALASYRRAFELDATYLPALEGLGNLLVQDGQLEEALRIYTAIIIHHRDGLTDLEVVETHWQIGEIADKLGQADRAIGSFKKALEIDQGHEPSRRSLIRLLEAAGDWEGAVEQRQRLVPSLDGQAKFEALVAIGAACRDQLQDPYQAIDAYLAASRVDPGHLPVTEALLGLYRETRQGQKAADVLGQLLARPEVAADPARAAKLHVLLAEILVSEVKDEEGAIREWEAALDANPRVPQAFAAIEGALTKGQRWAELEQAYLRMIQRLPKTPDAAQARLALWKTLGELYRTVLKNDDGARQAYQVVSRSDPEDAVAVELYAELAARAPGQDAEAVAAYRQLLKLGAKTGKALSALVGLHANRKEYDRAYSAAQVLAHLFAAATPEEQAVVSRLRKYARDQVSRPLDDEGWGLLLHERARGPLADIMTLLALHARPMFEHTPKELGINPKKEELDVEGSMLFFVNMFKYVERSLGLGPLRLFRREDVPMRIQLVPTDPLGVLAGEELFRDRPKKELWFSIGKAVAFARPELLLARLMPHDQLDQVFQAACSVGTSKFVVTADPHQVAKLKRELEKVLPEKIRANTLKLLARQYTEVQHPGDVRAYLDGAELTSNRVGTLLGADLEIVRRSILSEKAQVSKLRDETKLKDLSLFCVSEEYAALRERLGLAATVPT